MFEPEKESRRFSSKLFSGDAVDDEVDGGVEDEEQVVQVLQHVEGHGNVVSGKKKRNTTLKKRY